MQWTPSIPWNPGELYRQFRDKGWKYNDFGLPAWMWNIWAIVANFVEPKSDWEGPTVEFRYTAPTWMSTSDDALSGAEIRRRVQMTASILGQQQVQ